jgi:hypothetical protein
MRITLTALAGIMVYEYAPINGAHVATPADPSPVP